MVLGGEMNVFIEPLPNADTRGNRRIYAALQKYLPLGVCESSYRSADLVVFYVCGRHDQLQKRIAELGARRYAMIHIALESTRNPNPTDWLDMWHGASVVWSYYKLPLENYYHAPLAADPELFHTLRDSERKYLIMTNGSTERDESLQEIREAADRVNEMIVHVNGISDAELRWVYNQCRFVNALRRKDGFELPAVEGLLCGARPIMYDTPNYRQWFDGLAEFIPEEEYSKVVLNLVELFHREYRPVSLTERLETLRRFDWSRVITGFWSRAIC